MYSDFYVPSFILLNNTKKSPTILENPKKLRGISEKKILKTIIFRLQTKFSKIKLY